MANDIPKKAAEQARKWQQLSDLLRDPEITAFLQKEYSRNGASSTRSIHAASEPVNPAGHRRGDVIKTVKAVCAEFLPGVPFTAHDVIKKLEKREFVFASQNPETTVNGAIRKLVHKYGKLRIRVQGKGRTPSRYEVIPPT